jgi:hypothetical protein
MTLLPPLLAVLLATAPPPPLEEDQLPHPPFSAPVQGPLSLETLQTPRFSLRYTPRAKGAAEVLATQIEALRDDVRDVLGRDFDGVTEVRLGYGREEYEALALPGGRPPSWAVALAYPDANVVLVEAHSLIQGDGQVTLRHELVHVALGRLGHDWPRWFQEGMAQLLTHERQFHLAQFTTLARAVAQNRVMRLQDLTDGFPAHPEDVELAYAESLAFVEYLRDQHGPRAMAALIEGVHGGDAFEKAFGKAFHAPLSTEEHAFDSQLPRRYPWWPTLVFSSGSALWAVMAVLLVIAHVRRRRVVHALRAEQARAEAMEDAVFRLLTSMQPENDDVVLEGMPPQPIETPGNSLPWRVIMVRASDS